MGASHDSLLKAAGAIRSFTTEGTEGAEAGRKGVSDPVRTLLPHPSP
jgi:hypothetical protein